MASSVTKQQVETGLANENEIVIAKGLEKDDRVMLTAPADKDKLEMKTLPGAKPGTGGVPQPGPADTPIDREAVPVKPARYRRSGRPSGVGHEVLNRRIPTFPVPCRSVISRAFAPS